jgi:tRNA A37 threonylcarbamoyladenosine dehydratase
MKSITEKLNILLSSRLEKDAIVQPVFFRINDPLQKELFAELLNTPGIIVSDFLITQIEELIKIKTPYLKFTDQELRKKALSYIEPLSIEEYGVWVYYPWSNKVVHTLDEEEFIKVRTSRNQYKITPTEQKLLRQKKIGVIGLSVGQSVSLTLCMERICGEIRLADFDKLELTNLNRIRTGISNIGLPKVYSVAREIAEIDPFIIVKCYEKGISETNLDSFLLDSGKLDLLIEESDGFDIKIQSRIKAKEHQIPVLMEASDRCMVDVERFDLETLRPILHGLVNHLDLETLKKLKTTEQKIPYMLDILGIETSSPRLKASMLEIDQTINTWPQLASSVTMGGGIAADVARRILLGTFNDSGRYYVDIEEIIKDKSVQKNEAIENAPPIPSINVLDLAKKISVKNFPNQITPTKQEIETIVLAAGTAPSGGNSQPWHWIYKNQTLLLFLAFDSNHTILGFNNLASLVGLGAAIENALLKTKEIGYSPTLSLYPNKEIPELVAAINFSNQIVFDDFELWLAGGIDDRLSNRKITNRHVIKSNELNELKYSIKSIFGADLTFFNTNKEINEIAELLGELEKIRILEKLGHKDFVNEIRWTDKETQLSRDGVDIKTIDLSNSEIVGLTIAKSKDVIKLVNDWEGGGAFKKLTVKSIKSSGAIGLISMPSKSNFDYINGGRALQRAWISANLNNIAFQPLSASLFLYERLLNNGGEISEKGVQKLLEIRPKFEKILNIKENKKEIFLFRLLKATDPEIRSLRKPLNEIYTDLDDK